MNQMYPLDRRKVAIHIYSIVSSLRKTAMLLNISHSTVARWLKHSDKKSYIRCSFKTDQIVDVIRTTIEQNPFSSLTSLRELIKTVLKLEVSKELIRIVIKRCNLSSKKARFYGEPKDLEIKTKEFIEARNLLLQQNHQFVSIDETSFGRSGPVVKGYSKVGKRLFVRKNTPRMTTVSSIACVSEDGLIAKKSVTGCFNTERFLAFLKELNLEKRTVILLDNVRFHHSKVVKEYASLKEWILLFVPPYSPWYNPIEFCFSIIKRDFYKYQDIEKAYKCLTASHCLSFFKKSLNCSYLKI